MANISTLTVQIDADTARLTKELKKASKRSSKFARDVKKHGKQMVTAFVAVGGAAAAAFAFETIKNTKEFTKAVSELSAITGATGKDLKFVSDEARRYGRTTQQTASQAAEAFKLVASAKPDLLSNAKALSVVTGETIVLAEAAGIALPDAAKALGESLNQFGAGADQASRFINVLAAGSQQGAVEIPQISEALVNAGVAASQAGLDFEETVAALEALGKSGIKGSLAGSKLRTVLSKLTTQSNDNFNPAIVGMSEALFNLEEAQLSSTEKLKLFGQDSVYVVDALLSQREEYERLNKVIRDTDTAYEQQAKMNDNLSGDLATLTGVFEGSTLQVGLGFEDAMRDGIQATTDFVNFLSENVQVLFDFADAVFGIEQSVKSYKDEALVEEIKAIEAELEAAYSAKKAAEAIANQTGLLGALASAPMAAAAVQVGEYTEKVEELRQRLFALNAESQERRDPIIGGTGGTGGGDGGDGDADEPSEAEKLQAKLGVYAGYTEKRVELALAGAQAIADGNLLIDEALDAQKIERTMLTDEALIAMAADVARRKVEAEFEAEQAAKGELGIAPTATEKLKMEKEIGDETVRIAAEIAKKRIAIEADAAAKIKKYDFTTLKGKENTLKATLGLASSFGKKNEKIQKAVMLAEKLITITKAGIAIVGGTIQALNNPYPANLGFAAQVAAQGGALLGTLSGMGGGGGGASLGGGSLSSPDYATNTATDEDIEQERQATSVQVIIQGDVNGVDDYLETKMIPALEAAVNERDFVFIREGSRQAEEILA